MTIAMETVVVSAIEADAVNHRGRINDRRGTDRGAINHRRSADDGSRADRFDNDRGGVNHRSTVAADIRRAAVSTIADTDADEAVFMCHGCRCSDHHQAKDQAA